MHKPYILFGIKFILILSGIAGFIKAVNLNFTTWHSNIIGIALFIAAMLGVLAFVLLYILPSNMDEQKDFYSHESKRVNFKGKIIPMDDFIKDILENENDGS